MSEVCQIPANADISGIGIRIGIYITSFLVIGMSCYPQTQSKDSKDLDDLRLSLSNNAGLSGCALAITAFIQTLHKQLDLFHAIIIVHQLFFLSAALLYSWDIMRVHVPSWNAAILTLLAPCWHLYVLITAPKFGPLPTSCNSHTIYVFWFHDVSATALWFRWVVGVVIVVSMGAAAAHAFEMAKGALEKEKGRSRPASTEDMGVEEAFVAFVAGVAGIALGVALLELTVARNNVSPGEGVWSFGQIVSVYIAAGGGVEVANFILRELTSRPVTDDGPLPPAGEGV